MKLIAAFAFVVGGAAMTYLAIYVVKQYSLSHLCTVIAAASLLTLFLLVPSQ